MFAGEAIEAMPFYDLECEMAVLGAIFINVPEMTDLAMQRLRPHWFHNPRHTEIFAAIRALWQNRHNDGEIVRIDTITVSHQLRRLGAWRDDSAAHLTGCAQSCPTAYAMPSYLKILDECAARRQLHELGIALQSHASEPETRRTDVTAAQLINAAKRVLDSIETGECLDVNELLETGK